MFYHKQTVDFYAKSNFHEYELKKKKKKWSLICFILEMAYDNAYHILDILF